MMAATKAHLAAVAAVNPVQDTAEVMAAKAEHAEAHKKAAALAAVWRKKRSVVVAPAPLIRPYAAPYAATYAAPYVAAAAVSVRQADLTKTVLNPGHAVAYRVY